MTTRNWKFHIPIETEDELKLFVQKALGINIPDKQVCAHHDTPFRAFADAYFAREPIYVWHAARGFGGKSITLAALGLTEAITLKADVSILGGSGEQSQNVHKYNQIFWANPGMLGIKQKLLSSEPTQRETTLNWGNTIRALLASQTSVRGPHPQRLRCVSGNSLIKTPNGETPIRLLKDNDTVSYFGENYQIIRSFCSGIEKVYKITLRSGKSISVTRNHKFFTKRGWIRCDELTFFDLLNTEGEYDDIVSISEDGFIDVWDLTVDYAHAFIANGIVVHNCDEIDEMDIKILDAALGQPMSKNGIKAQTVLSSTWQNPNGTMTEILNRARRQGYRVYRWCMEETKQPHGWLSPEDIENKKKTVTEYMWLTEYCLASPTAESRAIHPDSLKLIFDEKLGVFEGRIGERIEIDPLMPEERSAWEKKRAKEGINDWLPDYVKFISGADWAKEKDNTVIYVFREDCKPHRLVAFYRMARAPWPVMVEKFDEFNKKYHPRSYHDNTGLGDVIDDYLTTASRGINMVGRTRKDMLSNAINKIERAEIIMPMIRYVEEELRGCSVNDVYGTGHLPDVLSALSLTLKGAGVPNALELVEFT